MYYYFRLVVSILRPIDSAWWIYPIVQPAEITAATTDGLHSLMYCIPANPDQRQSDIYVIIGIIHIYLGLRIMSNLIHTPLGPL